MVNHSGIRDDGALFQIIPTTRKIAVPASNKIIGTVGDHNSEEITFQCPKTIDGHEVMDCTEHYIIYKNADGVSNRIDLTDITLDGDNIFLTWVITSGVTASAGDITFAVYFVDRDNLGKVIYRWGTTICNECMVLESVLNDNPQQSDIDDYDGTTSQTTIPDESSSVVVKVTYNGTTMELTEGQKLNLSCEDKKMLSDVEIMVNNVKVIPKKKTFALLGFNHTSPNDDNTFDYDEGMTWAEWKNSKYNQFTYGTYGSDIEYHFATMSNGYTDIDVACCPDTPLEGICYTDGTPVKDNEVITGVVYHYCDLDSYEESPTEKTFILEDRTGYGCAENYPDLLTHPFMTGMTWGEWRESGYADGWYSYENGYDVSCDITCSVESPNWAVFNANGTPVKDDEVIKEGSGNYYLADADEYDPSSSGDDDTPIITFSICGKTYQADKGMTFGEWCESNYDHGSWYVYYRDDGGTAIVDDSGDGLNTSGLDGEVYGYNGYITANDVIVAGHNYDADSNW